MKDNTVNYVRHYNAFFARIENDFRLRPTHLSIYSALFFMWNRCRWKNPISVSRAELMSLSKVGGTSTYYRCMHELHQFGYIVYMPSKDSIMGSLVRMIEFKPSADNAMNNRESSIDHVMNPYINHENILNTLTEKTGAAHALEIAKNITVIPAEANTVVEMERKESCAKEKKEEFIIPPDKVWVLEYFHVNNWDNKEAEKFFNHYESNGWMIGKNKMKNWKASANSWKSKEVQFSRSNSKYYNSKSRPGNLDLNQEKNYDDPL